MPVRIDVDAHFLPRDVFDDVDARFGDRRPRLWFDAVGRGGITYPERESHLSHHQRVLTSAFSGSLRPPAFWEPQLRLAFMDSAGIDMQVLVPDGAPFAYDVDPELGASVCQSYNNAAARTLRQYPGRFIGLAHVPMQSPTRAVAEADRAISKLGLDAVLMLTNVDGRNLDDPRFWPVYAKVEELGVPLVLHPSRLGKILGLDRLEKFHLDNALGFLYEATSAITSLICGGVLDLFPRLRIAVLETGCGYLPTLMDRLNEVYDQEGVDQLIQKRPHEYLDRFWISANVQTEAQTLAYVLERFPAVLLMMATDFPHGLGGAGDACIDHVLANRLLSQMQKDRILGLAAADLFGTDVVSERPALGASTAEGAGRQ